MPHLSKISTKSSSLSLTILISIEKICNEGNWEDDHKDLFEVMKTVTTTVLEALLYSFQSGCSHKHFVFIEQNKTDHEQHFRISLLFIPYLFSLWDIKCIDVVFHLFVLHIFSCFIHFNQRLSQCHQMKYKSLVLEWVWFLDSIHILTFSIIYLFFNL